MRLLLLTLLVWWPSRAVTQQVVLPTGTLTLPPGFTHQAQRGTNSYPGRIVAQDGSLVIQYDIGPMAGAHVHPSRRGDFLWFLQHDVNKPRHPFMEPVGVSRRCTLVAGRMKAGISCS